jgi:hypothetical protein
MTLSTDIQAIEKKAGVFLSAHHIVLYILLAGAGLFGVYAVESKWAAIETARADAAQQALAVEKDHNLQLQNAFATAQAQRDKENQAFLQTITQLQSQTKVQIVHDRALPAPELGRRIETITGFKQGTVGVNANQDLVLPLTLGQEIVARLDQGDTDAKTVVAQAGVIVNQQKTITDQAGIIANDKVVLAGQIETDKKVLDAEKANGRKGKLKWFVIGFVSGFVGRAVSHP